MKRLKICHIIPTLVQGGAEKQMSLLARHLDRERFETHVIVLTHSGPLEQELLDADIPVHFIEKRGKADPLAIVRLKRLLKKIAPDVVHTWLFAANSYGRLAARKAKVPVIVAGERSVDPWKTRWHGVVDRFLMKYTATIATNTSAVASFYASRGIPADRFTIIPNAVIPSSVPPISREEFFQRLNIAPRKFVVGAVGRLWPQKGYRNLIWSAELLNVALEDVWFVIVGDGPERQRLQELRDRYGAQDAVRFVGHRTDAQELISGFDVLWNGSLYEGQSNTILEAMSWGKPVVASDIPGNRDLVDDKKTGFLLDVDDLGGRTRVTNNLLRDPAQLEKLGAAARRKITEQFSLKSMVGKYEELYRTLYEESR